MNTVSVLAKNLVRFYIFRDLPFYDHLSQPPMPEKSIPKSA
jgi:hypothetical protein